MSQTVTADKVIGNRLRVKSDTQLIIGFPGSGEFETIKAGRLTPPVDSWIEENGKVYWILNELGRARLIEHNSSNLELVPDGGGAGQIEGPPNGSGSVIFGSIARTLDFFTAENVKRIAVAGGLLAAGFIGFKILK